MKPGDRVAAENGDDVTFADVLKEQKSDQEILTALEPDSLNERESNELSGRGEASSAADVPKDETLLSTPGMVGNNRGCSRVEARESTISPGRKPDSRGGQLISDNGLFCLAISAGDPGVGFVLGEIHNIFKRALDANEVAQKQLKKDG